MLKLLLQRLGSSSSRSPTAALLSSWAPSHNAAGPAAHLTAMSAVHMSSVRGPLHLRCSTQRPFPAATALASRAHPGSRRSVAMTMHLGGTTSSYSSSSSSNLGSARAPLRVLLPVCQAGGGAGAGGGSGSGSSKGYGSGSGSGDSGGGSGGLWGAYTDLLAKHPLLVKAVTTALLSAVGNLICQFLVEGREQLDWRRLNTFTALGLVWVAPCLHFWFGALNRLVTTPGNAGALARMALDQLGFAPLFISSMIAILALLEGRTLDSALGVVRRDLPDAIRANWALWVPAQFVNFRFVPASYQVLFANMVALLWNVYFSFATRPKTAA